MYPSLDHPQLRKVLWPVVERAGLHAGLPRRAERYQARRDRRAPTIRAQATLQRQAGAHRRERNVRTDEGSGELGQPLPKVDGS